jgi:hypothetical protein
MIKSRFGFRNTYKMTFSARDALGEIAKLAERSVNVRALLGDILDQQPVVASLEVDHLATMRAGHVVMQDKPSDWLLGCLAALRVVAANEDRNSLRCSETHITPA